MTFVDINHGLLVLGISRDYRRPAGRRDYENKSSKVTSLWTMPE